MASAKDVLSAQRLARVRWLFDCLVEVPGEQRARRLDQECAGDMALRAELERLLAAHDRADQVLHVLEDPLAPTGAPPAGDGDRRLDPYRLAGQTISHYRILERIGDGGMGVVYRAVDERLARNVALKFLSPDHGRDPVWRERLIREARAASALDHPNICPVHDIGESSDGHLFIAMAYCDGESLRERIARGPLAIDQALGLVMQLTGGLGAVHRRGIIHRDVKPGNVMVSEDGVVRILDFGLARGPDATLTRTRRTMGTVAYMSPEQLAAMEVDARTDLWSLGVVLYEMVTGQRPFRGDQGQSVIYSILNEEPQAPRGFRPDVPEPLERILAKLLAKDPDGRYATAGALRDDVEAIRAASEPRSGAQGLRRWARTAPTRPRVVVTTAAVGVLGLWMAMQLGQFATARPERGPLVGAPGSEAADTRPTVAVLPFDNLSSDSADFYFAEGVHDEVLVRVAKIASLKVMSRTSVLPYRDRVANLGTIAGELGARYVVEATVRRFRDRVVVSAQLFDATTDDRLWSDRYERVRGDLFDIQTDFAERIAAALRAQLSPQERALVAARPTENAAAHDLYLRAGALRSRSDPDSIIALLERAVQLDPGFARAFVMLSAVHRELYFFNVDPTPARLARARQAIDRALALDPELPEAHRELGRLHYYGYRDYPRALAELEIARAALPNEAPLYGDLGLIYRQQGRFEDAEASFRAALERNPSSYGVAFSLGATLFILGDLDGAERYVRRAMVVRPDVLEAPLFLALIYCRAGRTKDARAVLDELEETGDWQVDNAWLAVFLTERRFDTAIDLLEARSWEAVRLPDGVWPRTLLLGRLYQWTGDRERSLVYFDSARVMLESELETLPDDPRIHAALGHAEAGLGRKEAAIRASRRATELSPIAAEAVFGAFRLEDLADVYANVGEPEKALEILDLLLSTPSPFYFEQLRRRAEWDPLRNEPGFARLVERYGR